MNTSVRPESNISAVRVNAVEAAETGRRESATRKRELLYILHHGWSVEGVACRLIERIRVACQSEYSVVMLEDHVHKIRTINT